MAFERIEPWGYPVAAEMLAGLANGPLHKKDKSLFVPSDFMAERKPKPTRGQLRNQLTTYLRMMGAQRVD